MDYVEEYLKRKPGRAPTAQEYIDQNDVPAGDIEGEGIAMAPRRLQKGIERLANEVRRETQ